MTANHDGWYVYFENYEKLRRKSEEVDDSAKSFLENIMESLEDTRSNGRYLPHVQNEPNFYFCWQKKI